MKMQTATLLSAALTAPTAQAGSGKPAGGGAIGSFTQVLVAMLAGGSANGGAAQSGASAGTPANSSDQDGKPAGDAAAEQALAAAAAGALVPPTTGQNGTAADGVEPGQTLPGNATAQLNSLNGQIPAQSNAAEAAIAQAEGLALTAPTGEGAEGGTTPGSATAQAARSQGLGTLLSEGGGKGVDGSQVPSPTVTGQVPAEGPDIVDPVLVRGAVDPSAAVDGDGAVKADRLGIPIEVPVSDKSATVAAESAIRISALAEASNAKTDGRGAQTGSGPSEPARQAVRVDGAAAELAGKRRQAAPTAPANAAAEMAPAANAATESAAQSSVRSAELAFSGTGAPGAFSSTTAADAATPGLQNARPATPALVQGQVTLQITKAVAEGLDRITIQLHPENLGRVDVRLDIGHDGRLMASIAADRPETLEMLQRDARGLERALQEAGLKTGMGSLSFQLRGNGGDGSAFGQQLADGLAGEEGSGNAEEDVDLGDDAGNTGRTLTVNGLLDIHV